MTLTEASMFNTPRVRHRTQQKTHVCCAPRLFPERFALNEQDGGLYSKILITADSTRFL